MILPSAAAVFSAVLMLVALLAKWKRERCHQAREICCQISAFCLKIAKQRKRNPAAAAAPCYNDVVAAAAAAGSGKDRTDSPASPIIPDAAADADEVADAASADAAAGLVDLERSIVVAAGAAVGTIGLVAAAAAAVGGVMLFDYFERCHDR